MPGALSAGGGATVHRALEKAGELVEGPIGEVRPGVQARPRGLGDQHAVAVCIGNGHASERVVGDERREKWCTEVRGEEGANVGPVGVG